MAIFSGAISRLKGWYRKLRTWGHPVLLAAFALSLAGHMAWTVYGYIHIPRVPFKPLCAEGEWSPLKEMDFEMSLPFTMAVINRFSRWGVHMYISPTDDVLYVSHYDWNVNSQVMWFASSYAFDDLRKRRPELGIDPKVGRGVHCNMVEHLN